MAVVGVYQIPAANELAWRTLIAAEAIAKGWIYREDQIDMASLEPGSAAILVTSDPQMADLEGVESWTVLGADPVHAAALLVERLGMGKDSLWHIARRGAVADVLLRRGGALFDAADAIIDIAGFGPVAGPPPEGPLKAAGSAGPLALYANLPVPVGAKATWLPDVYKLPTELHPGVESIDLMGLARLLIQGPYFDITPGTWALTVDLEIDAPGSGIPLSFEWGHGTDVTELSVTVRANGMYRVVLEHTWAEVSHADLRILLVRPTFHGQLRLVSSEVERIA
jgi:hypothetical protein